MSHPQPRHAAPDPTASVRATRTVRFWAVPIVITLAVMSALAALYLGGILKPMTSLRHFPIAIVNEDAGPTGKQIVNGLVSGLDKNRFEVRALSRQDVRHQLDTAQVYGAVGIPNNFTAKLRGFLQSAVKPGGVDRPTIAISTNPRAGTLGANIASQAMTKAVSIVNRKVGERLSEEIAVQTNGAQLPGAVTAMLTSPIHVESEVYKPLPNGTGNGLSAFYYALLLLLAGFTGSIVVSMLVDSMLGYVPAEFGPVYRFAEQVRISRFRTLLVKWALMVVLALLTSAVYMAIASGLGMPIDHGWLLWLYGVFAIAAVGITSTSLIAVLGTIGLLVSLLLFVILGLPSAGATVPLEAAPSFFGWLAKFEPMHQVFLGTRALLYLDGLADAGLSQALILTGIGLLIGLLLGGIVTSAYDRRGYHRIPVAAKTTAADEPTNVDETLDYDEATSTAEMADTDETTATDQTTPADD